MLLNNNFYIRRKVNRKSSILLLKKIISFEFQETIISISCILPEFGVDKPISFKKKLLSFMKMIYLG